MRLFALVLGLVTVGLLAGSAGAADPEVVTFKTKDRLTITGDLWTSGRKGSPGVVALHMYPADRTSWAPVAELFQKAGVDFLAIDMRGYGDSAKQGRKDLSEMVRARDAKHFRSMWNDALAAVAFLVERGTDPGRIAFLGASVGCSVAIDAAARAPGILGAVVMTPGTSYLGVETTKHLKGYGDRPLLILSSKEEADKGANAIAKALGKTAELQLLDRTGVHGTMMFGKVPEIESRIVTWLGDLLGAGVHLDGEVTESEETRVAFGDWDMIENGRGRPAMRVAGRWLYAAIRLEAGGSPPERFRFGWARDGKPDRARRILCEFERRGATFTLESFASGNWKPVRGAFPKGTRLGVSGAKAVEILIPRRLEGLGGEGSLSVSFGLAREKGDSVSMLPVGDDLMNRIGEWLDFGL